MPLTRIPIRAILPDNLALLLECGTREDDVLVVDQDGDCYRKAHGLPVWDVTQKSRGLGDTIKKITTAVGIKPCSSCSHRADLLNRAIPYSR